MATIPAELVREARRAACILVHGFDPALERHPEAPRTRADCANIPRPCPFVGCRENLFLDAGRRSSRAVKLNFRGVYECPSEMPADASCALDLAESAGPQGLTLERIGQATNLHGERVRQIEVIGLRKMRRAFRELGISKSWLESLSIEPPESAIARASDLSVTVSSVEDLPDLNPRAPTNGKNGHSKPPTLSVSPSAARDYMQPTKPSASPSYPVRDPIMYLS